MSRPPLSRLKVVGPACAAGAALSACAALKCMSALGWGPGLTAEVWASVLAGPFAGLWAAHGWGPGDALGWAVAVGVVVAAHPLRAGWLTGAASAAGVGVWVLLGFALTYDGV